MPFCPKCHDEFQDWAKTCPDCQVALVSQLPSGPTSEHDRSQGFSKTGKIKERLFALPTPSDYAEAMIWSEALEKNGVHCLQKGIQQSSGYSRGASVSYPRYEIYVLESEAERAREILGRMSDPTSRPDRPRRATKSAEAKDELVAVASPSNALESMTWAETLENNGIHCFDKSVSQYSTGASYPYQQIYVLRSDVGKARKILGRMSDYAAGAERSDGQPSKKRRFSTTAAGIADITNGVIYLGAAIGLGIVTTLHPTIPAALTVIGVLAIAGGVCTLLRKNWWMAVAGSIVSMLPFFPIGLMGRSRDEFE